jgi:CheY-like chemotaxis protein
MPVPSPDALRVLIVDDCPDTADILAALLDRQGYDVRVVYDPCAAIKAAAEFRPHAALLDICMPECDGYSLARTFRRSTELGAIRLIAVTGYADEPHRDRAAESGFDVYVVKPYSVDALKEAINAAPREPGQANC